MPFRDDDDDVADYRFRKPDDEVDDRDIPPDDLPMHRCRKCRKLILEDSEQCPYCKHYQLNDERNPQAKWVVITALVLLGLITWGLLGALGVL